MRTLSILFVLLPAFTQAQVWLDPSFGTGGVVTSVLSTSYDGATCMAIQPDGKIVVAGTFAPIATESDFMVARYLADGSLDATFGTGGFATVDVASGDLANGLALQTDGSIVVVGTSTGVGTDKVVLRFTATGQIDLTFNGTGSLIIDDSFQEDQLNGVAIQSDGKIVIVGQGFLNSKDAFYIARLEIDGAFDSSFGTGGQIEHPIFSDNCGAYAVAIMDDGRIVSVGTSYVDANTNFQAAVARYMPNGDFDATFSTNGRTAIDWSVVNDVAYAVLLQPDGKILVGGADGQSGPNTRIAASRLLVDGSFDVAFATNGTFRSFTGAVGTQCGTIAFDADGKILLGGTAAMTSNFHQSYLCRLLPSDGQLDIGFGTNGELFHGPAGSVEGTPAMAVQSDGKILLVGTVVDFPASDVRLLRYLAAPLTGIEEVHPNKLILLHGDATGAEVITNGTDAIRYEVFDELGTLLAAGSVAGSPEERTHIDFNTLLPPGAYTISLGSARTNGTARFVVAR